VLLGRNAARPAEETPGFDQGAGGDVECPFSVGMNAGGKRKEIEQSLLHGHESQWREAVETADFTGFAVDGELGFEAVDLGESGLGGVLGVRRAEGEYDLELGGHRSLGDAQEGSFG